VCAAEKLLLTSNDATSTTTTTRTASIRAKTPYENEIPRAAAAAPQYVHVEPLNLVRVTLSREDMGRAGWTFLHAIGGALGELDDVQPLPREETRALDDLVHALTVLYPCEECRKHFASLVKKRPPRTESSAAFQTWLCEAHNDVNVRLGKPLQDCSCQRRVACDVASAGDIIAST
jgi:FAD-linked sulfhydryl oxidase